VLTRSVELRFREKGQLYNLLRRERGLEEEYKDLKSAEQKKKVFCLFVCFGFFFFFLFFFFLPFLCLPVFDVLVFAEDEGHIS
jgi:hypothetical protein